MKAFNTNYTMSCFASIEHRKETILNRLGDIIATMDVPEQRTTDLNWMLRNLGIRNKDNENFEEAIFLIRLALRT